MNIVSDINKDERREVSEILLECESYDLALEVLEELREEYKEDISLLYDIARVYEKKGLFNEGIKILRMALKLDDTEGETYFRIAIMYRLKNNLERFDENLNKALARGYESENIFLSKGIRFEEEGSYDYAIEFYQKALVKNKKFLPAKYRLYKIYSEHNRIVDMEELLENMLRYNPEEYEVYHLKFAFLINSKRNKEVSEILEKAKAIFGENKLLILDCVRFDILTKNYESALEQINKIDYVSRYYEEFMVEKAKIYLVKGEYKDGIELLESVYDKNNIQLLFNLGILKFFNGDNEGAIKEFEGLESLENAEYYKTVTVMLKGYAMKKISNTTEVKEYFEKVSRDYRLKSLNNPYNLNYKVIRILALVEEENYDEAQDILESYERLQREDEDNVFKDLKILVEERRGNSLDIFKNIWM